MAERQSFNEHVIASESIRSKIKINEEVTPDEMVDFYRNQPKLSIRPKSAGKS